MRKSRRLSSFDFTTANDTKSFCSIKPRALDNGYDVIRIQEVDVAAGSTNFEIAPVLLNMPELMDSGENSLFIVLQGLMTIDRAAFDANNDDLKMKKFNSRVAYFREQGQAYDHILGAHHDLAIDELGHPAFHMQLDDYSSLFTTVADAFGNDLTVGQNCMRGVPKRVRIPCAQLDTFSVAIQLVADHLLGRLSSDADRQRFSELLKKSQSLQGAGYLVPRLQLPRAYECYRASHWYPE